MKKTSRNSAKTTTASTRKAKTSKKTVERTHINSELFIVPKVESNPRRKGSHGFKSLQIVFSSRKPVKVEQFVEKGGRLRDLHWDVNHGNVKLVNKAS